MWRAFALMILIGAALMIIAACDDLDDDSSECDPAVTDAWQVEQDKLASIPGAADVPEGMSPKTFQAMIHCWAALHGFTALEAHNHLDWLPEDARDAMFEANVRLTALSAGLPVN
jgi:hypothetical protein